MRAVRVSVRRGQPLKLSMRDCHLEHSPPPPAAEPEDDVHGGGVKREMLKGSDKKMTPYDADNPGGSWRLDLSEPYWRAVAYELMEKAWAEEDENWHNEKMNGRPIDLPEPAEGEEWTHEDYTLPMQGVLSFTYVQTQRMPRLKDVLPGGMLEVLLQMMTDVWLTDDGVRKLLTCALAEFYVTAWQASHLSAPFFRGHLSR